MSERLIIIGAGGHGKVVADIAVKCGCADICFVDDKAKGQCMGYPIIGTLSDIPELDNENTCYVIAVGENKTRKKISERYNVKWATLIHPSAQIGCGVTVGAGTVIMACAVVNVSSVIGNHCIINSGAIVEHDNIIGDYVHISPGVTLGGTVQVGDVTHIGIGATVKNNIHICEDCIVGAGAIVVENLNESTTFIGVPAKKHKK